MYWNKNLQLNPKLIVFDVSISVESIPIGTGTSPKSAPIRVATGKNFVNFAKLSSCLRLTIFPRISDCDFAVAAISFLLATGSISEMPVKLPFEIEEHISAYVLNYYFYWKNSKKLYLGSVQDGEKRSPSKLQHFWETIKLPFSTTSAVENRALIGLPAESPNLQRGIWFYACLVLDVCEENNLKTYYLWRQHNREENDIQADRNKKIRRDKKK